MVRKTLFASLLASSAIILAVGTTAHANTKDRAREAIAAAEAKINTAESIGTGVEVPGATAQARASLAMAKEDFASGRQSTAIDEAIHSSELADTAIGELQRRKDASIAATNDAAQASVSAAHDEADASVAAAQDQAANARQQAADANARADAAQQAAASSAVEAQSARDAIAAQAQPTQVETTVTTAHQGAVHHSIRTVQHTTQVAPVADQVTTTTTVAPH
jgi:hypothetical protein